jgi:hypothetical protein
MEVPDDSAAGAATGRSATDKVAGGGASVDDGVSVARKATGNGKATTGRNRRKPATVPATADRTDGGDSAAGEERS